MNSEPLLSVVVVSRSDDHGGNLLQRMQLFVSGWLEQAKKHNLSSELVIVEWNPLPDRPRLARALEWPKDNGACTVRIIEVPPEIHQRFKNADRLPLFQMIGKNVGIRRARGRFILATNIDILFSDELMQHFASGQLMPDRMYRIDRYDVPSDIPSGVPIDEQLNYCRENVIRINSRAKTLILRETSEPSGITDSLFQTFQKRVRALRNARDIARLGKDIYLCVLSRTILSPLYKYRIIFPPIIYGKVLHTNACGDFTLMAREHWLALRGNAEFETYSLYLDGLTCAVAHYGGAKELILPEPMRIYHIEHAPGSGWAPGVGAKLLDERLKMAGIPQL
ncbi:MAG: hypothetical protein JSV32_02340, partial [Dehalococcoidia bacterium]